MFKKIALITVMALSFATTAFAQEEMGMAVTAVAAPGQEMSTAAIVEDLYKNETSGTVKQLANDLLLVLTGEKEPAHIYPSGLIEIGTYPRDYNGAILDTVKLVGDRLMTTHTDNTFTVFLTRGVQLTPEYCKQCKADLQMIYNKVLEARVATNGMSKKETVEYLAHYIADTFTYDYIVRNSLADAIRGQGVLCEPYSIYFYILATGCGIETSCQTSCNDGSSGHAWNTVKIDGVESVVDVCGGDGNDRMDAFLFVPKDQYAYAEQRDIWVAN